LNPEGRSGWDRGSPPGLSSRKSGAGLVPGSPVAGETQEPPRAKRNLDSKRNPPSPANFSRLGRRHRFSSRQILSRSGWARTELAAFAQKGLLCRPRSKRAIFGFASNPNHRAEVPRACLRPHVGDAARTKFTKRPNPSRRESKNVNTAFRSNEEDCGWGGGRTNPTATSGN